MKSYNAVQTSLAIYGMQEFLDSLDTLDKSVQKAVTTGMHAGAKIIQDEQKRLILARTNKDGTSSSKLANLIKIDHTVAKDKTGTYRVFVGYSKEALNQHPEALAIEFGRPSMYRNNAHFTIEQVRNGKKIEVINGYIPEYSHIRRAWDNKISEAAQAVIDSIDTELKYFGYGNVNSGSTITEIVRK